MIDANRAVARLGYERIGLTEAVVEATTGWYGLLYHLATPHEAYEDSVALR